MTTYDSDDLWPIYVMVVEDEPFIRSSLAGHLRDSGFTVIEAANADEALAYYNTQTDLDLIVTDIQMAGSMNGLEMARVVHDDNPFLPLIITSGILDNQRVDDLGPFLPKPYRLDDAAALVFRTLRIKPPQRQSENRLI